MASIEERFQAAVNVIKGLPKNGPYQPSTAMMLKFYGLYKQATEGPCENKKPGFWDIVGKSKWDAWNDNRHLNKEEAMQRYVEALREIIETMSFTENVQNFVGSISGLDNINLDELEMVAPGMRELAESHPNSPFNSRTNSPQHGVSANTNGPTATATVTINGHAKNRPLNGDISSDTDGPTPPSKPTDRQQLKLQQQQHIAQPISASRVASTYVEQSDDEYVDPIDIHIDMSETVLHNTELLKQIQATVLRMNADLSALNQRMGTMEKTIHDVRTLMQKSRTTGGGAHKGIHQYPNWWPFTHISPTWFIVLVLWPFVLRRVSRMLLSNTSRQK